MDLKELEEKAAAGDMDAQYELAMKLIYGDGADEDNFRAAQLLEVAALQGHREAAYNLGVCYHYGHGVDVDLRTAYQLYLRSAMQGYGKGLALVGDFYAEGICVRQSWREAIKWYLDATASTDLSAAGYAEYKLACILANGNGVEQDIEGAKEWFQKAIDHGEDRAKEALEQLGLDGKFHIREARLSDAEAIWRLNTEVMGYDYPLEQTAAQFKALLEKKEHKLFVAVADGRVVGYLHGTDYELLYAPKLVNVLALAVDEAHRRKGMARALLEKLEAWAKATGASGVRLVSGAELQEAHACYTACGYERKKNQVNFKKLL